MIEILKLIGSAMIASGTTLLVLFLQRKWAKDDKKAESNKQMEEKIDKLTASFENLNKKVDKLAVDFEKETADTDLKNRCLQAGLREMLYDRIKYLSRKYISEDKIREEEYKSLVRMWEVYHNDLGGNGFLDDEMSKVDKLNKV